MLSSFVIPAERAASTILSSILAVLSAIHTSPHCEQMVAGTCRSATAPLPGSALKVAVPLDFLPPQRGQVVLDPFTFFALTVIRFENT
jgi:hypothetical protein